jgi:hypothetical protein
MPKSKHRRKAGEKAVPHPGRQRAEPSGWGPADATGPERRRQAACRHILRHENPQGTVVVLLPAPTTADYQLDGRVPVNVPGCRQLRVSHPLPVAAAVRARVHALVGALCGCARHYTA